MSSPHLTLFVISYVFTTTKMLVTVVYATDDNFVKYTLKSIRSLIKHSNPMNEYEIFVLTSNVKDIGVFDKLTETNIRIHTIEPDTSILNDFANSKSIERFTFISFYRFLIPYVISRDWAIYLDGDTLIRADISELYSFRDNNYAVAGVYDIGLRKPNYINSGVMLMNLKYMREIDAMKLFKECYTPDAIHGDQDTINSALQGKIRLLPLRYNLFCNYWLFIGSLSHNYVRQIYTMSENCVVIHFVGEENKEAMMSMEI